MKHFSLGAVKKSLSESLKPASWGFWMKNLSGAVNNKNVHDLQFADTFWIGKGEEVSVSSNFKMRDFR